MIIFELLAIVVCLAIVALCLLAGYRHWCQWQADKREWAERLIRLERESMSRLFDTQEKLYRHALGASDRQQQQVLMQAAMVNDEAVKILEAYRELAYPSTAGLVPPCLPVTSPTKARSGGGAPSDLESDEEGDGDFETLYALRPGYNEDGQADNLHSFSGGR